MFIQKVKYRIVDQVRKFSDRVYYMIDIFFQEKGETRFTSPAFVNPMRSPESRQAQWELNQGVADIALRDFALSVGALVPLPLKKLLSRQWNIVLLYLFTDEIVQDHETVQSSFALSNPLRMKGKILEVVSWRSRKMKSLCADFLNELKALTRRIFPYFPGNKSKATEAAITEIYYLLPDHHSLNMDQMIRGPNHFKLAPTFFLPMRI